MSNLGFKTYGCVQKKNARFGLSTEQYHSLCFKNICTQKHRLLISNSIKYNRKIPHLGTYLNNGNKYFEIMLLLF